MHCSVSVCGGKTGGGRSIPDGLGVPHVTEAGSVRVALKRKFAVLIIILPI